MFDKRLAKWILHNLWCTHRDLQINMECCKSCSAEWISDVAVSTRLENAKGGGGRERREIKEGNKTKMEAKQTI